MNLRRPVWALHVLIVGLVLMKLGLRTSRVAGGKPSLSNRGFIRPQGFTM